jgi:DNA-binding MarR family transcriptional regulator
MPTTPPTTTELTFTDALVRLAHLVDHVFVEVSREHGLTPQQMQLLCLLVGGPVGMTELSRLLHLEKSSLTGMVDRVERRGLVARTPHSHDRRACLIALTKRGAELAEETHRDVTSRLESLAIGVGRIDRERVSATVGHLVAARARQG